MNLSSLKLCVVQNGAVRKSGSISCAHLLTQSLSKIKNNPAIELSSTLAEPVLTLRFYIPQQTSLLVIIIFKHKYFIVLVEAGRLQYTLLMLLNYLFFKIIIIYLLISGQSVYFAVTIQ